MKLYILGTKLRTDWEQNTGEQDATPRNKIDPDAEGPFLICIDLNLPMNANPQIVPAWRPSKTI